MENGFGTIALPWKTEGLKEIERQKKTQWQAQAESTESMETVPGIHVSQTQRSLSMMLLPRH